MTPLDCRYLLHPIHEQKFPKTFELSELRTQSRRDPGHLATIASLASVVQLQARFVPGDDVRTSKVQ